MNEDRLAFEQTASISATGCRGVGLADDAIGLMTDRQVRLADSEADTNAIGAGHSPCGILAPGRA